jgi:hypothetical protein
MNGFQTNTVGMARRLPGNHNRMRRHAALITLGTVLAAVAASGPAEAKTHSCKDGQFTAHVKANRLSCKRALQVSDYWEHHGKCPAHWRFTRTSSATSPLRCTKRGTHSWVQWAESEANGD